MNNHFFDTGLLHCNAQRLGAITNATLNEYMAAGPSGLTGTQGTQVIRKFLRSGRVSGSEGKGKGVWRGMDTLR